MPRLTYRILFTDEERDLLRAATPKTLVAEVLADLANIINGEAKSTASARLARNKKMPPSETDLDAAVEEMEARRTNLSALPQTEKRDEAIALIGKALDLLHATQEQVRQTTESNIGAGDSSATADEAEHYSHDSNHDE